MIEGDQETLLRRRADPRGRRPVVQINTGAGCHLDADDGAPGARGAATRRTAACCSSRTSATWSARRCSTSARRRKVVVISVTEGDDKPLKYPHMFAAADLVVLNKTDLLPYVDFDLDRLHRRRPPAATRRRGPARLGDDRATNLDAWYDWLADRAVTTDSST